MFEIIITKNEQKPYEFKGFDCNVSRETLKTGDYSVAGFEDLCTVERKSPNDLAQTFTKGRERFKREFERMLDMKYCAVVVEAPPILIGDPVLSKVFHSRMNAWSLMRSCIAWDFKYKVPFYFAGNRKKAEALTFKLLTLWERKLRNEQL